MSTSKLNNNSANSSNPQELMCTLNPKFPKSSMIIGHPEDQPIQSK